MPRTIRTLALALALAAAAPALPEAAEDGRWKVETTPMGTIVTNGEDVSFRAPDQEAGEEMADALNDADRKAERKADREERKGGKKPAG